jgi:hypothetical protein
MNFRATLVALAVTLFSFAAAARAQGPVDLSQSQMPSVIKVPPEAQPSDHFDVEGTTSASTTMAWRRRPSAPG